MSTPTPDIFAENLLSDEEHKNLDVGTIKYIEPLRNFPVHGWSAMVLDHILKQAPSKADLRTLSPVEIHRILSDERVLNTVKEGVQLGTFKNVRNLATLRKPPVLVRGHDEYGIEATMRSWNDKFIGKAHETLYKAISNASDAKTYIYERFLDVVQSSGIGKSRMIDELSKEHFVIPINLRTTRPGFPPGDYAVSEFLVHTPFTPDDAYYRAYAFLISLFEATARIIPHLDRKLEPIVSNMLPADHPTTNAQKFRLFMTFGQSYLQPGMLRNSFYYEVIRRAKRILELLESSSKTIESEDIAAAKARRTEGDDSPIINLIEGGKPLNLRQSAFELIEALAPDMPFIPSFPLIILAYDEAHILSFPQNEDESRSQTAYSLHRRVMQRLRTLPFFALFLSTTETVHDPTPPPQYHPTDHLRIVASHLVPPFSELGFDQVVNAADGQNFGINDVSKVQFMVLFGRPLWGLRYKNGSLVEKDDIVQFATRKLMHGEDLENPSFSAKLALMSVRLALEFNTQTTEGRARKMEQVDKYMRVRIPVDKTVVTISPSEPLLAEAARTYMAAHNSRFNMPASLLEHLTTMGLDKRDRGKLVAQVILILAADKACKEHLAAAFSTTTVESQRQPILETPFVSTTPRAFSVELFIKALLEEQWHDDVLHGLPAKWRTETESNHEFRTAFKDTKIYFTHFIKIDDLEVVNREFLWKLAIRGCVALYADGQGGIDIIAPLVFGIETLCRSNVSALFVQVTTSKNFRAQPNTILFDLMDSYLVRFFDMDEKEPLPIIRMVLALGSPTAAVKVIPQYEETPPRKVKTATQKAFQRSPRYTSYDIWCAKASSETFGVIMESDEQNYSLLLNTGKVFPQAYCSEFEEIELLKRSMNPGTSVKEAHWGNWASLCGAKTPQLPIEDWGDDIDFAEEDEVEE